MPKTSFGVSIPQSTKDKASAMMRTERRASMSGFIEWLIEQEHDRRAHPPTTNQRVEYSIGTAEEEA